MGNSDCFAADQVSYWLRAADLHQESIDGQLVVFDARTDQVHCLDEETAGVVSQISSQPMAVAQLSATTG